jgi:hypothetical protein
MKILLWIGAIVTVSLMVGCIVGDPETNGMTPDQRSTYNNNKYLDYQARAIRQEREEKLDIELRVLMQDVNRRAKQ